MKACILSNVQFSSMSESGTFDSTTIAQMTKSSEALPSSVPISPSSPPSAASSAMKAATYGFDPFRFQPSRFPVPGL
ncbi:hypothetical protein [Hallerella succinigenes]|uniref:hypothetical protein n=1 Tax=Hallerella succinigenes TaxID=1896222 RepID=UPI0012FD6315|nr:hypothetical protein [Hallerella succinigenes]